MDVLFAVLPFSDPKRPAIGVSLLKAAITRRGFTAAIHYFNLDFAEAIGVESYTRFADILPPESLIGEWFFADCVFGERIPPWRDYVSKVLFQYGVPEEFVAEVLELRTSREPFIEHCVREIRRLGPRVVGLTTSFHQTCPCLAVASRLKQGPAPPIIILGGGNCEGEMGLQLARSFPWIDYVCTGEGDVAFPEFLERLRRDGEPRPVAGIVKRGEDTTPTSPPMVRDMDDLPIPDYADYFDQLAASPLRTSIEPDLLFETSRGCWWGAKNHCTFCGLNGTTMAYRSKSPDRVLREIRTLADSYGTDRFFCVDNILDLRYIPTVLPNLRSVGVTPKLFFETKANLQFDQLASLRDGGVYALQPGIESFSNQVLRLMRKGCTGLQNIQFLRWCEELGIRPVWNILYGFPGESPSEYERMAELIPALAHLMPPGACARFRLDRFSPLFTHAAEFGLARVRPSYAYYYVFPLGRIDLGRLAYYFDFDYADGRDPWAYTRSLNREVIRWSRAYYQAPGERPRLDLRRSDGVVVLEDTRACAVAPVHRLEGLAAEIYLLCDHAQGIATLRRKVVGGAEPATVEGILEGLLRTKLMVEMGGQYLSLAVLRDRAPRTRPEGRHGDLPLQEAAAT
jgi:ribosomal peptide maturation radical SAM protein 1